MKTNLFIISLIFTSLILSSCTSKRATIQNVSINEDSIKTLILSKEKATLSRWYNGDPLGFIDNSWKDVTYFDPSLKNRIDSLDAFRKFLTPIIGQVKIPSHEMEKPLIQIFGDIAILTFTDVFTIDGNTSRWHATEIYLHRDKDWKIIHAHWTESKAK